MTDYSQYSFWARRQIQSIERCLAELRALPQVGSAYTAFCPACDATRTFNRFGEGGAAVCVVCGCPATTFTASP